MDTTNTAGDEGGPAQENPRQPKMQSFSPAVLMRFLILAVLTIGAALPAEPSGVAATPADIVAHFGLLGFWSPNCSAPASQTNPRVVWGLSNGTVVHSVSFDGRSLLVLDTVATADDLSGHDLRLKLAGAGNYPKIVTVRMMNDRVWAIYSADADGHVFYDEGIEVLTGKPSLIDERCEALTS